MTKATFLVTFTGYLAVLCTLVVITSAQAQGTVNVNFGFSGQSPPQEYTGLGVAPDAGNTFWNFVDDTNLGGSTLPESNLTASDGTTSTGIGFSLSGIDNDVPYEQGPAGISLYQLGFRNNQYGSQGTLTINGLDNSKTYDVYAYSQVNHSNPAIDLRGGTFTIGGTSHTASATPQNHSTFEEGVNYVKFPSVAPSSSEITVTISNHVPIGGVDGWVLNAFKIQEFTAGATDFEWIQSGVGDWNIGNHWSPSQAPNSPSVTARFGTQVSSPTTVATNEAVTVNRIEFANTNHTFAIGGLGSVSMAGTTAQTPVDPTISVDGTHLFQAVVNLEAPTIADVSSGSTLTFDGALNLSGTTLTKTGEGTLVINNRVTLGGGTIIGAQGTISGTGNVGGDLNNQGGLVGKNAGDDSGICNIYNFNLIDSLINP